MNGARTRKQGVTRAEVQEGDARERQRETELVTRGTALCKTQCVCIQPCTAILDVIYRAYILYAPRIRQMQCRLTMARSPLGRLGRESRTP